MNLLIFLVNHTVLVFLPKAWGRTVQSLPSKARLHPTHVLVHSQISQRCTVPFLHSYTSPSHPGFWLGCLRLPRRGSKQQLLQKPPPTPSRGTWPKPAYLNDAHSILKGIFAPIYFLFLSRLFFSCLLIFSVSEVLATSPSWELQQ